MPTKAVVDGTPCELTKLANGVIRVEYPTPQVNSMHGLGTGGMMSYEVHPCQQRQYSELNAQISPHDLVTSPQDLSDQRPWWSLSAGERAGLKD